jgi:hypothetical protein
MSVCVLAMPGKAGWARAVAASAGRLILIGMSDGLSAPDDVMDCVWLGDEAGMADAVPGDAIVLLAGSDVPGHLVRAFFATPAGQAGRKIVDGGGDHGASAELAPDCDMLIFDVDDVSGQLGPGSEPIEIERLLPLRALLVRPNQAVVVRLDARSAVAVWADRTLLAALADDDHGGVVASLPKFCGIIAAAVERGIGPEPALTMALRGVA